MAKKTVKGFFDNMIGGIKKWATTPKEITIPARNPNLVSPDPQDWKAPQPNLATNIQPTIAKTQPQITPTPQPVIQQEPEPTPMIARNQSLSKFNVTPQVETAIRTAASTHKITPEILGDIAIQESSMDPTNSAERGGFANSTSKGLYMFNDPTWETVQNYKNKSGSSLKLENDDRMDPNTSAQAAAYLIANGQLGRWYPSAAVWAPNYTWEELQPYLTQTTDPEALATIKYYAKK